MGLRELIRMALVCAVVVLGSCFSTTLAFVTVTVVQNPTSAVATSRPTDTSQIPTSSFRNSRVGKLTNNHLQPFRGLSKKTTELCFSNTSESSKGDATPSWALNPIFATAWVALVVFAFGFSPGDLGDNSLVEKVMADPVHPDINEAYYTLFNVFVPLSVILAALVLPQGQLRKGLPAGPFVASAAFLGFFTLGLYLSLRAPPRDSIRQDEPISWVTRLLENKIINWSTLALLVYLPYACGLVPDKWADPSTWDGLWELFRTNRFASVSAMDLVLLHTTSAFLIVQDYLLRTGSINKSSRGEATTTATKIAAAAFFFPFVGPALYCALRPQLPILMDETD